MSGLTLAEDYQAKEVVRDAWGRWLSDSWDWDWWVTLTFDPVSIDSGGKFAPGSATHTSVGWQRSQRSWDAWLSRIEDKPAAGGLRSSFWFRGREPNPNRRGTHFHALVGGVAHLSRRDAWQSWFTDHGLARIEPYNPRRGAGFYVSKYVVKELGDLRFSENAGAFLKGGPSGNRVASIPGGWRHGDGSAPFAEGREGQSEAGWVDVA
jgi:hypothetical protein